MTVSSSTSSSASSCHRRWGCGVGKCLLIPMMIALITSMAHAESEGAITPKMSGKKLSTTFKHKYGAAVRRIVHYLPSQFERSLQGGNNNKNEVPTKSPVKTPAPSVNPTLSPSYAPTLLPTFVPSLFPSWAPSSFPTSSPSNAPSLMPSDAPSAHPTTSSRPSAAPIPYQRTERVELRYTPWSELTTDIKKYALQLDYNRTTWDNLGTNPIEKLDWLRLSRKQKNISMQLGYDRFTWDCWQNHFEGYRWVDLSATFVQAEQWWEDLGWDIYTWNKYDVAPKTDELKWYELSSEERFAAAQLCYFRTTWDLEDVLFEGFPIKKPVLRFLDWMGLREEWRNIAKEGLKYSALSWNVLGMDTIEARSWDRLTPFEKKAAESLGFVPVTWDCWQNHFRGYSWDDLVLYGLDFFYTALGWNELSWTGVESPPPSQGTEWKELTPEQRSAAAELCYFRHNWDMLDITPNSGPFLYPKVKVRYVEWEDLPAEIRAAANSSLLYNDALWNHVGTANIEKKRWMELTDEQRADANTVGFYERTWDCFQNHYRAYEWEELDRDSQDAASVLGWNNSTWAAKDTPPSYDIAWDQLSETEQSEAAKLCYFADNWEVGTRLPPTDSNGERISSAHSIHLGKTTSIVCLTLAVLGPLFQLLL